MAQEMANHDPTSEGQILNVSIEISESGKRSPNGEPRNRTNPPRESKTRWLEENKLIVLSIHLHESIAKKFQQMKQQMSYSDSELLRHLLEVKNNYEKLRKMCMCQPKIVEESEIINNENEEPMENSNDDNAQCEEQPLSPVHNKRLSEECAEQTKEYEKESEIEPSPSAFSAEIAKSPLSVAKRKRGTKAPYVYKYKYPCGLCENSYKTGWERKSHILVDHCTLYVECHLCVMEETSNSIATETNKKYGAVKMDRYFQHMREAHEITTSTCQFCKRLRRPQTLENFRDHIIAKHPDSLLLKCNVCQSSEELEEENMDTTLPSSSLLRCASMRGHIKLKHADRASISNKVSCTECKALLSSHSMARHIQQVHGGKVSSKNNLCDLCGKSFSNLRQHKSSVHKSKDQWKFECKHCNKKFAKQYNLNVHMRLHTGERPFVCDTCGKGYCQFVELRLHMRNHHSENSKKKEAEAKRKKRQPATKAETSTWETIDKDNSNTKSYEPAPDQAANSGLVFQTVESMPVVNGQQFSQVLLLPQKVIGQDEVIVENRDNSHEAMQTLYTVIAPLSEVGETQEVVAASSEPNSIQNLTVVFSNNANLRSLSVPLSQFGDIPASQVQWVRTNEPMETTTDKPSQK